MIAPNGGQSFWAEYGPNRFETLALGIAGGLVLASRVGTTLVAGLALLAAAVSYGVRRYVKL